MEDNKKFKLAIVMAGAVTAGAYTAGVIDYLIECLQKWEIRKQKNRSLDSDSKEYDNSIPMHDVEITVIGGTSAGGMTAVISTIALLGKHAPITYKIRSGAENVPETYYEKNKLYDGWVNLTGNSNVFSETKQW
jgi:hypothetical protein